MLRAILKREQTDKASGAVFVSFETFDFDEGDLEGLLVRGGLGEGAYDITELVGVEVRPDELEPQP